MEIHDTHDTHESQKLQSLPPSQAQSQPRAMEAVEETQSAPVHEPSIEHYYYNPADPDATPSKESFTHSEVFGRPPSELQSKSKGSKLSWLQSTSKKLPQTGSSRARIRPLRSTDVLNPKQVLPYFLRLLLTNEVEVKDSQVQLGAGGQSEDEFGLDDLYRGGQVDNELYMHQPETLPIGATGEYYVSKYGRRGATGQTNTGITEPLHRRWSRTVWRKEVQNLEPEYRLPALILKKHLYVKREEPTRLGPGTYDPHFDEYLKKRKMETTRGQMKSCARRFPKEVLANQNPGPGAYEYPDEALEKARREKCHSGKVSLLVSGPCDIRKSTIKDVGAPVGPGHYHFKGAIDELLSKRVSLRGPYDLFTPERFYYQTQATGNPLGPGQYNVRPSFKQEINSHCNRHKGKFSPHAREKRVTGERISLVSPLWPKDTGLSPGPGQYEVGLTTIGTDKTQEKYPFKVGASARPNEKVDYDMAPTRYNPEKPGKYCPLGCGHQSQFKSATDRLDPLKMAVLTERLRGKDVPLEEVLALRLQ